MKKKSIALNIIKLNLTAMMSTDNMDIKFVVFVCRMK